MRYVLLLYLDPEAAQRSTREDAEAELAAYAQITHELAAAGVLRGGEALMPADTATIVSLRESKRSGEPAVLSDLELGGFYLLECSESQAVDIAARLPVAAHGAVEIRPLMDLPPGSSPQPQGRADEGSSAARRSDPGPVDAATVPIMLSSSFDDTAGFYGRLGFQEIRRWPGEYLILRRHPGVELHFVLDSQVDPATTAAACYIRLSSAEQARALHEQWAALALPGGRLHDPVQTDYATTEFALVDAHGNLLRVGGPTDA